MVVTKNAFNYAKQGLELCRSYWQICMAKKAGFSQEMTKNKMVDGKIVRNSELIQEICELQCMSTVHHCYFNILLMM